MNNKPIRKKGFSLVEVIISLGITGIILVIFFNIIVIGFGVGFKAVGRSLVREEIASVENLILRDFRNADEILRCDDTVPGGLTFATCELRDGADIVVWSICQNEPGRVCRLENNQLSYKSSPDVEFSQFDFEPTRSGASLNVSRISVLLTMVGGHTNTNLDVNNIVSQITVSTRNYVF